MVLFLIILLGWLGDSLISVLIGRPRLSFHDVYRSWKLHWHRHPATDRQKAAAGHN